MINLIEYIKINKLGECYTNKSFQDLTTLKIGGLIDLLFYPSTIDNFIIFYKYYIKNKKYPLIVIGNGSNILASSSDYNGIVVCFKKIKFKHFLINNIITVNSGVMIMNVINYCKRKNLGGLEKLSFIPATVGGMVKMNAGAYNDEISNYLLNITVVDEYGNIKVYNKKEIDFSYRKCEINDNDIIIQCCFELIHKQEEDIDKTIKFIKENRKQKQPLEYLNAGSTFKNTKEIQAWKLIDELGLRGFSINDAQVSNKHCNFLINKKECKSEDMMKLINLIKNKVLNKYSIDLQCEWILINF